MPRATPKAWTVKERALLLGALDYCHKRPLDPQEFLPILMEANHHPRKWPQINMQLRYLNKLYHPSRKSADTLRQKGYTCLRLPKEISNLIAEKKIVIPNEVHDSGPPEDRDPTPSPKKIVCGPLIRNPLGAAAEDPFRPQPEVEMRYLILFLTVSTELEKSRGPILASAMTIWHIAQNARNVFMETSREAHIGSAVFMAIRPHGDVSIAEISRHIGASEKEIEQTVKMYIEYFLHFEGHEHPIRDMLKLETANLETKYTGPIKTSKRQTTVRALPRHNSEDEYVPSSGSDDGSATEIVQLSVPERLPSPASSEDSYVPPEAVSVGGGRSQSTAPSEVCGLAPTPAGSAVDKEIQTIDEKNENPTVRNYEGTSVKFPEEHDDISFLADRCREAYNRGYVRGLNEGYNKGHAKGHVEGSDESHGKGYTEGFKKGYKNGLAKVHKKYQRLEARRKQSHASVRGIRKPLTEEQYKEYAEREAKFLAGMKELRRQNALRHAERTRTPEGFMKQIAEISDLGSWPEPWSVPDIIVNTMTLPEDTCRIGSTIQRDLVRTQPVVESKNDVAMPADPILRDERIGGRKSLGKVPGAKPARPILSDTTEWKYPPATEYKSPSATEYKSPSATEYCCGGDAHSAPPQYKSPSATEYKSPSATEYCCGGDAHSAPPQYKSPSATEYKSPSATEYKSPSATEYKSPPATEYIKTEADIQREIALDERRRELRAEKQAEKRKALRSGEEMDRKLRRASKDRVRKSRMSKSSGRGSASASGRIETPKKAEKMGWGAWLWDILV